ncbi:MAG: hypothetical protein ACRDBG_00580, partial [Waterburya sp.]
MSDFTMETALELFESSEQFPVDFNDAWLWLEYSRKDNAKVAFLDCGFVENDDFQVFLKIQENPLGGRPLEAIKLTVDCFKCWGMMSKTETGKKIRQYFLECEKIAKAANIAPKPPSAFDQLEESGATMADKARIADLLMKARRQGHKDIAAYLESLLPLPVIETINTQISIIDNTRIAPEWFTEWL